MNKIRIKIAITLLYIISFVTRRNHVLPFVALYMITEYIENNDMDCKDEHLQFIYQIVHGCDVTAFCYDSHDNWRKIVKDWASVQNYNYDRNST